ncbi:hypothetical protein EOS93_26890 [Rhizobium sp. RMa-01]|nr:hypothetical protein EOS93_26890 [Rhizobium sp. RMa-01]
MDGRVWREAYPYSVILGPEPRIHAAAAGGCRVDARVKPEHDGGWRDGQSHSRRLTPVSETRLPAELT